MAVPKSKSTTSKAKLVFGAGAATSFITCIFLLIADKTASATVAATLTIVLLLFLYFPVIESFEFFGLKAKLRHSVLEIENVLAKVRKTAEVSAKLLYIQLAWMNRMGSITWEKKRELLSDIDSLLDSVEINKNEIDNLKQPFLIMIARDLLGTWQHAIRFRVNHNHNLVMDELNSRFGNGPTNPTDPVYLDLSNRRRTWSYKSFESDDILSDTRFLEFDQFTKDLIAPYPFSSQELSVFEKTRMELVALERDCRNSGTITKEAGEFLEKYSHPQDKLYREIFDGFD